MQRIGHLLPSSADAGGVAAVVAGLQDAAQRRGLDSRVLEARGERAARLPFGEPHGPLRTTLVTELSRLEGVVVHGVFQPDVARARRLVATTFPRLPVVAVPADAYDDGLFEERRLLKQLYFSRVERPGLQGCDAIVTAAPSHETWLRRRGVTTRAVVQPLGLTPSEHAAATAVRDARRSRRPGSPLRLLQVGRLDVREKGVDLAVGAVAALPAGRARLRLVGPTQGQDDAVHELVRRTRAPVDVVGFVPDLWAELAEADLVLMPSRKEGFGLAPLQALCAGVPVLLTSRAGLAEHVGESDGVRAVHPDPAKVDAGLASALADLARLSVAALAFGDERGPGYTYDAVLDVIVSELRAARR